MGFATLPALHLRGEAREPMNDDRIKQFEEVLAMDPDDPVVRYGLAQELMDADRHSEAIPHLREALRVKPDYSVCYHLLGLSLETLGDAADAREVYQGGIEAARAQGDLHVVHLMEERMKGMEN